jgi:hypothetical protein
MMKKILIAFLILALLGAAYGYYLWNMPQENMQAKQADLSVSATNLFKAFSTDEQAANTKYLGKTVAVTGVVKSVEKEEAGGGVQVSLETGDSFGVLCELDPLSKHPRMDFPVGESVTFKGNCTGFNFDVQLTRCVEAQK